MNELGDMVWSIANPISSHILRNLQPSVGYSQVSSFFENFIIHFLFEPLSVLALVLGGSHFFLREIISSSPSGWFMKTGLVFLNINLGLVRIDQGFLFFIIIHFHKCNNN
jgi:hypothetical protein